MDTSVDRSVLTFAAGGRQWAIDAETVAEVVEAPKVTRVPQAPEALTGLANLRGRVAPIVSVAALLGHPVSRTGRVIVLAGSEPIGLAVDEVTAMRRLGEETAGDDAIRMLDVEPLLKDAFAGMLRSRGATQRAEVSRPARPEDEDAETTSFLAFSLAGQTYALPMTAVREVAAWPETLTRLPHADEVGLGVMSSGGSLIPLVSLKALLGLPAGEGPGAAVVVAALGGQAIGLAVDVVQAILRLSDGAVGAVPTVLNRGAGEARIAGLARTPTGLVSVLAGDQIFREETVTRMLADKARADPATQTEASMEEGAIERFVLFRLGEERYGLPIAAVDEVLALPDRWTRVPRAPAFVIGVINHRGAVLPLVDQRRRFLVEGEAAGAGRRVIVTRLGETAVGFVVDSVERILTATSDALASAPELTGADTAVFDRVSTLEADGSLVLLVDPRQLLDQAERDLLRALVVKAAGSVQPS